MLPPARSRSVVRVWVEEFERGRQEGVGERWITIYFPCALHVLEQTLVQWSIFFFVDGANRCPTAKVDDILALRRRVVDRNDNFLVMADAHGLEARVRYPLESLEGRKKNNKNRIRGSGLARAYLHQYQVLAPSVHR